MHLKREKKTGCVRPIRQELQTPSGSIWCPFPDPCSVSYSLLCTFNVMECNQTGVAALVSRSLSLLSPSLPFSFSTILIAYSECLDWLDTCPTAGGICFKTSSQSQSNPANTDRRSLETTRGDTMVSVASIHMS